MEAARQLGRSERTIRRYIDQGKLAAKKEAGRVLVNLADITPAPGGQLTDPAPADIELARLSAENVKLSDEVAFLRRQLAQAGDNLSQAQANMLAALANQQKLLADPGRRQKRRWSWRWPWQDQDQEEN